MSRTRVTLVLNRPSKDAIEAAIMDVTAGLLARRGVAQTSLQAIADGVGYSKAGVLHHFASKDAVLSATVARCLTNAAQVRAGVEPLPPGRSRDQAVITALVDLAAGGPGFVSLMLASSTSSSGHGDPELDALLEPVALDLLTSFSALEDLGDAARILAITGALGAVAVSVLAIHTRDEASWGIPVANLKTHVVTVAMGALGHARPA